MKELLLPLLLCCAFSAAAQPAEIYRAQPGREPCPGTLLLQADGEYAFASGCETAPLLSFGTWTKKKDTIKLVPVNPVSYMIIKNMEATKIPGDSVWLTLLDKDGVNMTTAISAGLDVSGRGSYMMSNDGHGRKYVYKREGGKLVLRTLGKLFRRRIEFATDTVNNFIITLNLSASWIRSTHADWGGSGPFSLLKKGEALYSLSKNRLEEKWMLQNDKPKDDRQ